MQGEPSITIAPAALCRSSSSSASSVTRLRTPVVQAGSSTVHRVLLANPRTAFARASVLVAALCGFSGLLPTVFFGRLAHEEGLAFSSGLPGGLRLRGAVEADFVGTSVPEGFAASRAEEGRRAEVVVRRISKSEKIRLEGVRRLKAAEAKKKPKDDVIEMKGMVMSHSRNVFKVALDNGVEVQCTLAGKLRMNNIKVLEGDQVTVEMSPFDLTRGRITFRTIDKSLFAKPNEKKKEKVESKEDEDEDYEK